MDTLHWSILYCDALIQTLHKDSPIKYPFNEGHPFKWASECY